MKRILTWILALVLAVCCLPAMAEECSHNWKIVDPTCGKDGRKLCTLCGENEVLPATGAHTMVVTIEPTCKDEGEKMCSVCGKRESIAKNENHNWEIHEPTCGQDGVKLCKVCGKTEKLPATGAHIMKVTKEPTCKDEGEQACSVCGYTEKIAKNENHTWKTVEPTCGKDGMKLCSVCGKSEKLPATGAHTMVVTKTATCAEEGEKTCSVCGYTEKTAKSENHNWKTVEPTCGKDGMKLCAICGATEVLPATGEHDWIIKDAGCETEGKKLCAKCGATETIAPKGHDWVVGKEPTCTEAGDRVCVVCSKSEVLPASGHKAVKIPAVKATCKKEGSTEGEFCETCGAMLKEPQTVPVKKHSYYTKVVEPTADKSGYTLHTCRYCGRKYSSDRVEALGQGNDRIYGIVTDVNRIVKDYTLNTASEVAVINAAAEADGTFATRCLFLSEETVQKLAQAGCSEVRFTVGNASVTLPLNALGSETVVITLSLEDENTIGVKATIDDEAAQDVTGKIEGLTLTIANAKNTALATESGRAYDATFENGVWTIKVQAAETYILTAAR